MWNLTRVKYKMDMSIGLMLFQFYISFKWIYKIIEFASY